MEVLKASTNLPTYYTVSESFFYTPTVKSIDRLVLWVTKKEKIIYKNGKIMLFMFIVAVYRECDDDCTPHL